MESEDRKRERSRLWYQANREKALTKHREYEEANKERERERKLAYGRSPEGKAAKQAYIKANREKIKAQRKEYYERNKEVIRRQRKEYHQANRDRLNEQKKHYYCRSKAERAKETRKRLYGLEHDEFVFMLETQKHKCPICSRTINESAHVDHCHKTGTIRGLLCSNCNSGLGMFRDDPSILKTAMEYIEYWKEDQI